MPGILKIADLQERKRALVQESDVYRETLKLQFQNLSYCLTRNRQRFTGFAPSSPWLGLLGPFLNSFMGGRGLPGMRIVTGAMFAWKLLKKVRFILPFFRRKKRRVQKEEAAARA